MASRPVHPFDLFGINTLLSDEERDIRDTVRAMGERRLRPYLRSA
ncbi:hypothetical protein [Streptomyces sp. NPDC102462]